MKRISRKKSEPGSLTAQSDCTICRWGFSNALARVLILLSAYSVLIIGTLYAADGNDALFIDKDGNVGIGKVPAKGTTLDVNGKVEVREMNSAGTVKAERFEGDSSDLTIKIKNGEKKIKDAMTLIEEKLDECRRIWEEPKHVGIYIYDGWIESLGRWGAAEIQVKPGDIVKVE
jgi:hypothetical protein